MSVEWCVRKQAFPFLQVLLVKKRDDDLVLSEDLEVDCLRGLGMVL